MANNADDEMVSLSVPKRHYAAVVRALAEAMAAETGQTKATAVARPTRKGEREWTAEEVGRLRSLLTRPTARAMMDLASKNPGEGVTFTQVVEKVGCERRAGRGDLAAMTKLIRKRFSRDNWPLRVTQSPDGITYEASPEIAAAWNGDNEHASSENLGIASR